VILQGEIRCSPLLRLNGLKWRGHAFYLPIFGRFFWGGAEGVQFEKAAGFKLLNAFGSRTELYFSYH